MENMSGIPRKISSFRVGDCIYRTTYFGAGLCKRSFSDSRITRGNNNSLNSSVLSVSEHRCGDFSIWPVEVVIPGHRYLLSDSDKLFVNLNPLSWSAGTQFREGLSCMASKHNDLGINLFKQIASVQFGLDPFARSFKIKSAMLLVGEKHLTGPDEETEYPGTTVKFLFSRNLIRSSNEADLAVEIFEFFGNKNRTLIMGLPVGAG